MPTALNGVEDEVAVEEPTPAPHPETPRRRGRLRSFLTELPVLVLIALVLAVLVKTLAFQAFFIPSESMASTLEINDRVLVNKITYRFGEPQRGDIVVFDRTPDTTESLFGALVRNLAESVGLRTPEADLIKRIIALPGETIEIRDNLVYIDGVPLDEPYLAEAARTSDHGLETVPEDEYFVMGDNRSRSQDSRFFGTISRDEIIGKAFVIIWPSSHWSGL